LEQANRSSIILLARSGHSAADIVKLTKLPSSTVYDIFKAFKDTGKTERKHHALKSDVKRTPRFLAGLKRSITVNSSTPMTFLSKNRSVSISTESMAVKLNLNMKSYLRRRRYILTTKAIRIERCPKLFSHLKHKETSKIVVFVHEKKFIVDTVVNRHNARVILPSVFHTKNPASVMVFGAVVSDGSVMPPDFIDAGLKVNTAQYMALLKTILSPWMEKRFGLDNVVLVQYSVPYHGSKITQAFLANNVPFFVKSEIWPSNSSDLNVLDYFVWSSVQSKVNASPKASVTKLKRCLQLEFAKIDKGDLMQACRRFRRRIEAVINAQGGHIEWIDYLLTRK